jgi:NAD(P)-dependent dehydrogenase (short-subunit alcohol dehydrogenase family)
MSERFAVVTGSSQGLGLAICQYLLEAGYVVIGASRTETPIEHERFIPVKTDVRDEEEVADLFEVVKETTDALHLVVNNAGICQMSPVMDMSTDDFNNHLQTNIVGPFHIMKQAYSYLIQNETHFINISSIASQKGFPQMSAYCASKHGLNGLIAALREEWKHLGVRFTNLVPGAINTSLWDKIDAEFPRDQMLSIEEFMEVFAMVESSSPSISLPEVHLSHKSGDLS